MIPTKGREYLLRQLINLRIKEGRLSYDPQPLSEGIDALTALNRLQSQIITESGNSRITELENKYLHYEVYELITENTGTVSKAQGATILLNRYKDAGDAIVVKVDANERPIDEVVQTALGEVVVVTSFDTLGNYVLSRIPDSYPVALIYQIKISLKDSSNINIATIINNIGDILSSKEILADVTLSQTLNAISLQGLNIKDNMPIQLTINCNNWPKLGDTSGYVYLRINGNSDLLYDSHSTSGVIENHDSFRWLPQLSHRLRIVITLNKGVVLISGLYWSKLSGGQLASYSIGGIYKGIITEITSIVLIVSGSASYKPGDTINLIKL